MRLFFALALLVSCTPAPPPEPSSDVTAVMDYEGRFFDAPYPAQGRLRADGTIDISGFPGPDLALKQKVIDGLGQFGEGFGRSTAFWFRLSGPIDVATLPQKPADAASLDSAVYLVDVDESSPEKGRLIPLEVQFKAEQETYSPKNLLVGLPFQGHVPRPGTFYAAVLTRKLKDPAGLPLARAAFLGSTSGGGAAGEAARAELPRLKALLTAKGHSFDEVVAATVFKTGSHVERLTKLAKTARAFAVAPIGPITRTDDFTGMVVFEGQLDVPMYQLGDEPYSSDGQMVFDAQGNPVQQRTERIRFAVAVPKKPMPAAGFPLLFHVAGSGGDHRSIIDRGSAKGTGLARILAERGIGAIGIEANLTGPRDPSGNGDGNIFYNVFNPVALRDNHRQQVAEYEVLANLAKALTLDGTLVANVGVTSVKFDAAHFFVHGHSTGSVVGASILASNDAFSAGALSGAGGSWLYNLVLKQTPMSAELVKGLLNYNEGDGVDIFDPLLSLVATMWDPIEPMNQTSYWSGTPGARAAPVSVLLFQGLIDTYYLPRMVNALSMAAGMDLAAPVLDADTVELLGEVGHGAKAAPFSGNRSATLTYGHVQHQAHAGSDGHFVVFQNAEAQYQYGCFFAAAAKGVSPVVAPTAADAVAPCP